MQRRQVLLGIATTSTAGLSRTAKASDQLEELRDEVSRAQLFKRVIKAKKAEPPPATGEPLALPGHFSFRQMLHMMMENPGRIRFLASTLATTPRQTFSSSGSNNKMFHLCMPKPRKEIIIKMANLPSSTRA